MRVLVTGASGLVAGSAIVQAPPDWQVHAVSRGAAPRPVSNVRWHTLDPLDAAAFARCVDTVRPQAMLHIGGNPSIDSCERHQEEAWAVNAGWTERVAQLARAHGARLVYTSTDNVFDGTAGPYSEDAEPRPVNFYGATKLAGERAVRAAGVPAVVARVAIVMGFPMLGDHGGFLVNMAPKWARGEQTGVPDNEVRTPVDVVTLGRALIELAASDYTGTVHLAGTEVGRRNHFVKTLAAALGYDPDLVVANDPTTIPGRAPRPDDVSLATAQTQRVLRTPLCDVAEGARRIAAWRDGAFDTLP